MKFQTKNETNVWSGLTTFGGKFRVTSLWFMLNTHNEYLCILAECLTFKGAAWVQFNIKPQNCKITILWNMQLIQIHDLHNIVERKEAQILKFNAPPYTLTLSYPSYSKFSQLSYEPGCSRELWCRKCATWLWNKYVLIFSKTLFHTHIQRHTAAAGTKCYKTMKMILFQNTVMSRITKM